VLEARLKAIKSLSDGKRRMGDPLNNDEEVDCYFKSNDGLAEKEFDSSSYVSKEFRIGGDGVKLARSERSVLSFMVAELAGSKVKISKILNPTIISVILGD
jgi:hypothetical protein